MVAVSTKRPADPGPPAAQAQTGPTWERLEDQIGWYDGKASEAQRWYKRIKLLQLVVAAAIPIVALLRASEWVPGVLGAAVVVLEGVQQLYRHHEHWITYRSTCEALRRERFLYLAGAGPYASAKRPLVRLAERVEDLVGQETATWASTQQEQGRRSGSPGQPED